MAKSKLKIRNLRHLSLRVGVDRRELQSVAGQMRRHVDIRPQMVNEKPRRIIAPRRRLEVIQRRIKERLLDGLRVAESAHGYRKGRSTVTAAIPHLDAPYLLSLDVQDFFPGIRHSHVYQMWCRLGCSPDVSRVLTQLTTYEHHLPQGFVTSPSIANLVRASTDARIEGLCRARGLTYTSYSDNLYVSGRYISAKVAGSCQRFVQQSAMRLPRERVKICRPGHRKEVTGLVVTSKLNVGKSYRRRVRAQVHQHVHSRAATREAEKERLSLEGKIGYVAQVNPAQGTKLSRQLSEDPEGQSESRWRA
jgi:retron-type reverse transcriptase